MTQLVDADGDPATLPTALVNTRSYAYQYDQLNRLIDAQMGRFLTDSGGNIVPGTDGLPQIVQPGGGNGAPVPRTTHWTLDNLGNWAGGSVDGGVIVTPSVERLAYSCRQTGCQPGPVFQKTHRSH